LLVRPALAATITRFDRHGVCLQTTGYTCGPASAVTCLRRLGLSAGEGSLAIAADCGPIVGTDSQLLARALTTQFAAQGLHCDSRYVTALDQLPTPCIAETFTPAIGGHYVAVLSIGPGVVEIGDPFSGWYSLSRQAFEKTWTHRVITFAIAGDHVAGNAIAAKTR
jgi:ABC-type bacteriocin/lantibiotic exporter with double-glycine peptidase domain